MQARKQKLKGFAKETTKGKAQSVPSLKREREREKMFFLDKRAGSLERSSDFCS